MEMPWPIYGATEQDRRELFARYAQIYGETPPEGNDPDDYDAAYAAVESNEPEYRVKEWPSQRKAKEKKPDER